MATATLITRTDENGKSLTLELPEPTPQPRSVNITDVVNFVSSFPKGCQARLYAGDYGDWMLRARDTEPREHDYCIPSKRARNIRQTIDYLFSIARRVSA
jgi:hypothetical protein